MTRNQAIEIARRAALNSMEGYAYLPVTDEDAATWTPHEWVVKAICSAERRGRNSQATVTEKAFEAVNRNADLGEATQAVLDIAAERRRQVEVEGWAPEHDDAHTSGEMSLAACAYAHPKPPFLRDPRLVALVGWPWESKWWKPKDRRTNLVRAGALIAAEIERLDRAAG